MTRGSIIGAILLLFTGCAIDPVPSFSPGEGWAARVADTSPHLDGMQDPPSVRDANGAPYDASIVADKDGEATADVPGARLSPQTNDGSDDGGHSETQPDSDAGVTSQPQDCQPRTCYPVTDPTHSTCPCRY